MEQSTTSFTRWSGTSGISPTTGSIQPETAEADRPSVFPMHQWFQDSPRPLSRSPQLPTYQAEWLRQVVDRLRVNNVTNTPTFIVHPNTWEQWTTTNTTATDTLARLRERGWFEPMRWDVHEDWADGPIAGEDR